MPKSEIHWFTREPGEIGVPVELEPPGTLLIADRPDYVRLPPELADHAPNAITRVLAVESVPCPVHEHLAQTFRLACGLSVASCDRFYWYRTPASRDYYAAALHTRVLRVRIHRIARRRRVRRRNRIRRRRLEQRHLERDWFGPRST